MMRPIWKDGLAAVLVALAAAVFVLWRSDAGIPGLAGPRVATGVMLILGVVACGLGDAGTAFRDGPRAYAVVASLVGLVALVAAITALVSGSAAMVATLLGAMVTLWVLSVVRHAAVSRHRPVAP